LPYRDRVYRSGIRPGGEEGVVADETKGVRADRPFRVREPRDDSGERQGGRGPKQGVLGRIRRRTGRPDRGDRFPPHPLATVRPTDRVETPTPAPGLRQGKGDHA